MSKKRKSSGLEATRNRAGYTFLIHWFVGLILFFILPIAKSIWYCFNDVIIQPGNIETNFVGLEHIKEYLLRDPSYVDYLRDSVAMMFYSLPIIISVSLILAVLLNQKFKGKTFFRSICFLPVILVNSAVMNQLNGEYIQLPLFSTGEEGVGIIDYEQIIMSLNVTSQLSPILTFLLSNTINLIWSCGIQTILFLAGLQSISPSFYEVSKIEGANKWEEFWFITIPSLRNILLLVIIFTMIELFVDMKNLVVANAYGEMISQRYGQSSTMLWIYFAIVMVIMGIVLFLYNRLCMKRWE